MSITGNNKVKPPVSGDLYDDITQCGEAYEHLRLRLNVKATGVPMPLHMS